MIQVFIPLLYFMLSGKASSDRVLNLNESFAFTVQARNTYNYSGLRLLKTHTYSITASGTWKDGSCRTTDANGFASGECNSSSNATTAFLTMNETLRRDKNQQWFCLIGEIFDQTSNVLDNARHDQQFRMGTSRTIRPAVSGKLICFANDVITAYANNTGSVRVTVRRID